MLWDGASVFRYGRFTKPSETPRPRGGPLDPAVAPPTLRPMRDFLLHVWAKATTQVGSLVGHGIAGALLFFVVSAREQYTGTEAGVLAAFLVFLYREVSDIVTYMAEKREPPPFEKCADGFTDLWGPVFVSGLLAGVITGIL